MSDERVVDFELAGEINHRLYGGESIDSILGRLDPRLPAEWRQAIADFARAHADVITGAQQFEAFYEQEARRNVVDENARRTRPDRQWSLLPLLFLMAPDPFPGFAAELYQQAIQIAKRIESEAGCPEAAGLHKGVEYCNLGLAQWDIGDQIGALESILAAIAEDERNYPGQPSHAESNVLVRAVLERHETMIHTVISAVLPPDSQGTPDTRVISDEDVRAFCSSLDLARRLYLHGAIRRSCFNDSGSDIGKMERLTATRELTLFFESDLRKRLNMAGVQFCPDETLGHLLPRFAKHHGYSQSPWFQAVNAAGKYHHASAQDVDQLVVGLMSSDQLGLSDDRELFLARSLLMVWLLRNFSNHDFELGVKFLERGEQFALPLGYLLAGLVIVHLMQLKADFQAR